MLGFFSSLSWPVCGFLLMVLIFVITYLYEDSPKFKYHFKFVVYVGYVSTCALFFIPMFFFRPKNVSNTLITIPILSHVTKLLGVSWEIRGGEILAREAPAVVICNHQSALDILGMIEIWPLIKKGAIVARREVFWVFPFGLMAWLCGTVFIDRKNSSTSKVQISTTAENIQSNNVSPRTYKLIYYMFLIGYVSYQTKLWIFPEGTRHKGPSLLPFKKGAFYIALQNQLPIIPVLISPYTFVNDDIPSFKSGRMVISVLPQIETAGLEVSDVPDLVERTRDAMIKEFQRLTRIVNGTEPEETEDLTQDKEHEQ